MNNNPSLSLKPSLSITRTTTTKHPQRNRRMTLVNFHRSKSRPSYPNSLPMSRLPQTMRMKRRTTTITTTWIRMTMTARRG